MSQNRNSRVFWPQRARAAPLRSKPATMIALVLVLAFLNIPRPLAGQARRSQSTSLRVQSAETHESQPLSVFTVRDRGRQIKWQILGSGGNAIVGKVIRLAVTQYGTVGQTAVGPGSSPSYDMNSGFWQSFLQGFLRGDANADGSIDLGDVVYLVGYLYRSGPAPIPMEAGNANCDEGIEVEDIVYLVNYLLRDGPAPSC